MPPHGSSAPTSHSRLPAAERRHPRSETARGHTVAAFDDLAEKHLEYLGSRDRRLRNELVEAHAGLARHLAARFARHGQALDDLTQVAQLALIKAVERYDPSHGTRFATYATPTIIGALKRHLRDRSWSLHVPRGIQELYLCCRDTAELLEQELGHAPSVEEIATRVGAPTAAVSEALGAGRSFRALSLDAPSGAQTGSPSTSCADGDGGIRRTDDRLVLARLLRRLSALERRVVGLRFVHELSRAEVAEQLGMSQPRVSRLLARALSKLAGEGEDDSDSQAPSSITTLTSSGSRLSAASQRSSGSRRVTRPSSQVRSA